MIDVQNLRLCLKLQKKIRRESCKFEMTYLLFVNLLIILFIFFLQKTLLDLKKSIDVFVGKNSLTYFRYVMFIV